MPLLKPARGISINWSHPLAKGLTGCWLLGEGTGDRVIDLGPYRRHGNFQGGPPLWKPGIHGHCLEFDGVDECVDCGTEKFGWDITNELSVVACFSPYSGQLDTIFARSAFVRPVRLSSYYDGRVHWQVYTDNTNCNVLSDSNHAIDGSEWIQAIGTWREHDGRIYINGILENSESASNGNLNIYNDSQPVGISGNYQADNYYYCWEGKIDYVFVYNRALSAEEAKWFYREPFAMFDKGIRTEMIFIPAVVFLSGSINAKSDASATLSESIGGGLLTERSWLTDALFNGMTVNAFKLGTTLSLGWFWVRTAGCSVLYRDLSIDNMDFANILTVAAKSCCNISPPEYLPHNNCTTYFYVVRRFNNCGYPELTFAAAAKMPIDESGELEKPQPNMVFASIAKQVKSNKTKLIWFYSSIGQKSPPKCFNIYYDDGTGQIDYENAIATISYKGQKFYSYRSEELEADRYLFAIKTQDADGIENQSSVQLSIQFDVANPDQIEILNAESL